MKTKLATFIIFCVGLIYIQTASAYSSLENSVNKIPLPAGFSTFDPDTAILAGPVLSKKALSEKPKPRISVKTSHLMGDFTEQVMDNFFQGPGKWSKIDSQVGRNGIDGLYTRSSNKGSNPRIKVLVVEAKYNRSQLSQGSRKGPQGSKAWIKKSIKEKISSLEKDIIKYNGDTALQQRKKREIYQLKKILKEGSFIRRTFSAKLTNGQLQISLADIEEYVDNKTGKIKTKKKAVGKDSVAKKGSGLWKTDIKGRQILNIPLSTKEYRNLRTSKKLSTPQKKYLSNLRNQIFDDLKKKLRSKMDPEDIKDIIKELQQGNIKNSTDLNRAIDKRMHGGKSLEKTLRHAKFSKNQIQIIQKLSKFKVPGKQILIKKAISFHTRVGKIKSSASKTLKALKNPGRTTRNTINHIKKFNFRTATSALKDSATWKIAGKAAGKAAFRSVVIVMVVLETYNNAKFWLNYSRGLSTTYEAYIFTGRSIGGFSGATLGAWAGAQLGMQMGQCFGVYGQVIGGIVGGVAGGFIGAFVGSEIGDYFGNRAYSFYHDVENEELRKRYIRSLDDYCVQRI